MTSTANVEGMSTVMQVISSPPPSSPVFWAVKVMVTGTPGVATSGEAARSQLRAARTTAGEMMKAAAIRMTTGSRLVAGRVMRLAVAVAKR